MPLPIPTPTPTQLFRCRKQTQSIWVHTASQGLVFHYKAQQTRTVHCAAQWKLDWHTLDVADLAYASMNWCNSNAQLDMDSCALEWTKLLFCCNAVCHDTPHSHARNLDLQSLTTQRFAMAFGRLFSHCKWHLLGTLHWHCFCIIYQSCHRSSICKLWWHTVQQSWLPLTVEAACIGTFSNGKTVSIHIKPLSTSSVNINPHSKHQGTKDSINHQEHAIFCWTKQSCNGRSLGKFAHKSTKIFVLSSRRSLFNWALTCWKLIPSIFSLMTKPAWMTPNSLSGLIHGIYVPGQWRISCDGNWQKGKKEHQIQWNAGLSIGIKAQGIFVNMNWWCWKNFGDPLASWEILPLAKCLIAMSMSWTVPMSVVPNGKSSPNWATFGPQWPKQPCILPKCGSETEGKHHMQHANFELKKKTEIACAQSCNFNACAQNVLIASKVDFADAFVKQTSLFHCHHSHHHCCCCHCPGKKKCHAKIHPAPHCMFNSCMFQNKTQNLFAMDFVWNEQCSVTNRVWDEAVEKWMRWELHPVAD